MPYDREEINIKLISLNKLCIALPNLQLHKYLVKILLCDANMQHRHLYIFCYSIVRRTRWPFILFSSMRMY